MVHCVAFGCKEKSDGGNKGFFLFPKDSSIRKKWIEAVSSDRVIGGKIVKWTPTKSSRLCKRHFIDSDFVRSPSLMKSVGMNLKLELKKAAVPSVFPDSDRFKENKKPLNPLDLGPPKRKRKTYESFERKKHQHALSEILEDQEGIEELTYLACDMRDSCVEVEISATSYHTYPSTLVSRASQTETVLMEHKSFQCNPVTKEKGIVAQPLLSECGIGPDADEILVTVDKCYQFPDESEQNDNEMDVSRNSSEDENFEDPDWNPEEWEEEMSSEEESEEWDDFSDLHTSNKNYIVSESSIMQLLLVCVCGQLATVVKKLTKGTFLSYTTKCLAGHVRVWDNMKSIHCMGLMNLLSVGATVFSGASPSKVIRLFNFLNISFPCARTFYRIQRAFVLPAINNVWKRTQSKVLSECRDRPVRAGGDARCCSPGHSAKFGSYTLMDLETGNVLAVELVQSNEVRSSNAMELEGLKRALAQLTRNNVQVSDLTTDRHVQVRKFLREERQDINHWFDGWHLAKNIKSKLLALGKKKGCEAVYNWSHSISNHMYFCAATSDGDGELVEQKWLSILNHVTNKHEGHGDRYPRCQHEKIDREWIKAGDFFACTDTHWNIFRH